MGLRLLGLAMILYLFAGFLTGQTFFDRGAATDYRYLTMVGLTCGVIYGLTVFWLWAHDDLFGVDRTLHLIVPWVLILAGFGCFFLIR